MFVTTYSNTDIPYKRTIYNLLLFVTLLIKTCHYPIRFKMIFKANESIVKALNIKAGEPQGKYSTYNTRAVGIIRQVCSSLPTPGIPSVLVHVEGWKL